MNMKSQDINIRTAIVNATMEKIQVYKLKQGHPTAEHIWNRYLGDNITLSKVEQGQHIQTYTSKELEFIY